jgi:hypothetical protein
VPVVIGVSKIHLLGKNLILKEDLIVPKFCVLLFLLMIKGIFFAEFHPIQGPKIIYSTFNIDIEPISEYIIPKESLVT